MAFDVMRKAYASDEIREMMLAQEKFELDRSSDLAQARREGKAEGQAEGRAEGKAEGRTEIATRLINKGYSPAEVSDLIGISIEELKALKS